MLRLDRKRLLLAVLLLSLPVVAQPVDGDLDGVKDSADNCLEEPNPPPDDDCDTDEDGFGNFCDTDFNNDGGGGDFAILNADVATGIDSGSGTDLDCNGIVDQADRDRFMAMAPNPTIGPSGLVCAGVAPCTDRDHDGFLDHFDLCSNLATDEQCDTDLDGYGNHCDADFNQDYSTNATDWGMYFAPAYNGLDPAPWPEGMDMNCDGSMNATDWGMYFVPKFKAPPPDNSPGPSGLGCAGSDPCVAEPTQEVAFTDRLGGEGIASVTDSDGRLHAIYIAADVGAPNRFLKYVTQDSAEAPLTTQTIVTAPTGTTVMGGTIAIALDSDEQPCVVYGVWNGIVEPNGLTGYYGCGDSSGFSFTEVPDDPEETTELNLIVQSSYGYQLALDSSDRPHITFYNHDPHEWSPNHWVWHVWFHGSDLSEYEHWTRESLPYPPGYVGNTNSAAGICLAMDAVDQVHFVYGVQLDAFDGQPNPLTDYLGALAYTTWTAGGSWGPTSIIRADVAGNASPTEHLRECSMAFAADGRLRVVYSVRADASPSTPEILIYGRQTATSWEFVDGGDITETGHLSPLEFGADGETYFSATTSVSSTITARDLIRVDGSDSISREGVEGYRSSAGTSSVWSPTSTDTKCRVLSTHRIAGSDDYRFILSTFEECDEP